MKIPLKRLGSALLLCFLSVVAMAQTKVVGVVLDETGEPVIGASVKDVKNPQVGTVTDIDGNFTLTLPDGSHLVEVNYVGMQSVKMAVSPGKKLTIRMKEDNHTLNDVVVIGYQAVKRKDLTGSVASVTAKDVAAAPVSNVAQALQGKLPGVNVTSQDGRPDATVSIRVRGGGSISQSNDPLVLIDGVSGTLSDIPVDDVESIDVLKDASSTAIYGARGANGVILVTTKGAKEGKVSVTYNGYVKFNTPTKYLKAMGPYDYLKYVWAQAVANGSAYSDSFEKLFGLGDYSQNNPDGIESYRNVAAQDVQRDVYNSSVSHNHSLNITGGTDKTKVLFSVNYMDEQGMKINSFFKRLGTSFKLNQKIAQNLDFSLDTRYTQTHAMGDEGTRNGRGSLLSSAYRFRPIATSDILGDLEAFNEGNIEMFGKNALWDTYRPDRTIGDYEPLRDNQRLRATASLNWQIIKGLVYHTDFTVGRSWAQNKTWSGHIYNTEYMDSKTGQVLYAGAAALGKSDSWNTRWTNTLNYDKTIAKVHHLNVLGGYEITNSGGSGMNISASYFPANFTKENAFAMINQYDATKTSPVISSSVSTPDRIVSFFGRLNYTLMERYLFTATFRADGSSKFSKNHRWGYFPAAAFAWRITEESFMKNVTWLDNLKLRLSYGEVGNDGISSNLWSQLWASESDIRNQYAIGQKFQATYKLASSNMANPDLKWETTITRDIGFDFTLFKSRLWGTLDLYWNTTKDLLMLTTIPGITGFTSTYANVGQTSNKGLELSLNGVVYKDKDWNVTAGANFNFNKGNVDKLADNVTGLYSTGMASFPKYDYVLKEGKPVGQVRGLVYDGFYTTADFNYANGVYTLKAGVPDLTNFIGSVHGIGSNERPKGQIAYPGMPKFRDLDNSGYIDEGDVDIIGDTNPKCTGGFNFTVNWKNFDLGAYFNWSIGNKIYNAAKIASMYGYKETGVFENRFDFMKNAYKVYDVIDGKMQRVTDPASLDRLNQNAQYPWACYENYVTSSVGIENGSFLRLNTLTLGYSLPRTVLHHIGLSSLRVYGTIYNLFTITGYSGLDPEVNTNSSQGNASYPTTGLDWGTYPRARSFVVGLNVKF